MGILYATLLKSRATEPRTLHSVLNLKTLKPLRPKPYSPKAPKNRNPKNPKALKPCSLKPETALNGAQDPRSLDDGWASRHPWRPVEAYGCGFTVYPKGPCTNICSIYFGLKKRSVYTGTLMPKYILIIQVHGALMP